MLMSFRLFDNDVFRHMLHDISKRYEHSIFMLFFSGVVSFDLSSLWP